MRRRHYIVLFILIGDETMLIPDQKIKVRISAKTKNHYSSLGYNNDVGEIIYVPIEDLTKGCHSKILLKCDICGDLISREYKAYLNKHNRGLEDICCKCQKIKAREIWMQKYGVDHPFKVDSVIQKRKETWMNNFGADNPSKNSDIKEKKRLTYQQHYGVDNPSQSYEIRCKVAQSFYKYGNVPTSKPQIILYERLNDLYDICELNYPCGKYSLDCMININDCKIDIEYDGISYHENKIEKDKIRNEFVISQGYKILRIQGFGKVPELEELQKLIQDLVNSMDNIKIIKYI